MARHLTYRAFDILDRVPPGCFTLRVDDDRHLPHLRPGELVIVDPSDREYQCGEVFAVQQSKGPTIWEVRPFPVAGLLSQEPCLALHPLNRPRSNDEAERIMRAGGPLYSSDGPLPLRAFEEAVIGRVIGIWDRHGGRR